MGKIIPHLILNRMCRVLRSFLEPKYNIRVLVNRCQPHALKCHPTVMDTRVNNNSYGMRLCSMPHPSALFHRLLMSAPREAIIEGVGGRMGLPGRQATMPPGTIKVHPWAPKGPKALSHAPLGPPILRKNNKNTRFFIDFAWPQ